jgi:hypothetical protein
MIQLRKILPALLIAIAIAPALGRAAAVADGAPDSLSLQCEDSQECRTCVAASEKQDDVKKDIKGHIGTFQSLTMAAKTQQNALVDGATSDQSQLDSSAAASANSGATATSGQVVQVLPINPGNAGSVMGIARSSTTQRAQIFRAPDLLIGSSKNWRSLRDSLGPSWPSPLRGATASPARAKRPSWPFCRTRSPSVARSSTTQRAQIFRAPDLLIGSSKNWRSLRDSNPRYIREREVS